MNLKTEKFFWKKGYKTVAGLDEAGRGPLAGPVTAGAVVVLETKSRNNSKNNLIIFQRLLKEVNDSKKLSFKKRERIFGLLKENSAIKWGIGKVSEKKIDKINIFEATKLAMKKAINNLNCKVDFLILDGNFKINSDIPQQPIVKADNKVFSCAAASILAKVTRDKIMENYDKKYPKYGFSIHKGYPTKRHLKMLKKHGPCKIHRKSFKPVKRAIAKI